VRGVQFGPSTRPAEKPAVAEPGRAVVGSRLRRTASRVLTVAAVVIVWAALVMPSQPGHLTPAAFARIPVEGLVFVAVALLLRPRTTGVIAGVFGVVLAVVLVLKVLDLGFFSVFARPVDPLNDWVLLGPAIGVLEDSVGQAWTVAAGAAAVVLLLVLLGLLPLAALRVSHLVAGSRRAARTVLVVSAVAWAVLSQTGTQVVPRLPVASSSTAMLAYDQVRQLRDDLADRPRFAADIAVDRFAGTSGDRLLTGLRGKDVLLVFVESYGRVALEGPWFAPRIRAVLADSSDELRAAGYSSRSAYLTSPTFGGASWLAHATLQTGLWVDSQQRYGQLMRTQRLSLTSAFRRAGWRTVIASPANTRDWPEGREFYHADKLYDSTNIGYAGPRFSYAPVPDQYTLAAFHRLELAAPDRSPVMAEIDLVSSHHPWTPLPRPVPWGELRNGAVFRGMPEQGPTPEEVFRHRTRARSMYGRATEYALRSLVSYLTTYADPNLVVVMLGDHQPHSYVTGANAGFDVPVSLISQDPAVMRQIQGWRWEDGISPSTGAPVWRMDAFRDRFLEAFGPGQAPGRD